MGVSYPCLLPLRPPPKRTRSKIDPSRRQDRLVVLPRGRHVVLRLIHAGEQDAQECVRRGVEDGGPGASLVRLEIRTEHRLARPATTEVLETAPAGWTVARLEVREEG